MRKRSKLVLSFVLGLTLLRITGCAAPGRLVDLADCGQLSVGVGYGLSSDLKLGALTHSSFGLGAETWRIGVEDREVYGWWHEIEIDSIFAGLYVLVGEWGPWTISYSREYQSVRGTLGGATVMGLWLPPPIGFAEDEYLPEQIEKAVEEHWTFNDATKLSAGLTLGFIGTRIGINPLEIADFFLGFVGLDIANDDPVSGEEPSEIK